MTREIIFRGKIIKGPFIGRWVYGDLSRHDGKCFIQGFLYSQYGSPLFDDLCMVDPETIGQFTGLRDKDGNNIYEGDIAQVDYITTFGRHRVGLPFEIKWCAQEGRWVKWDGFTENSLQQANKMFVVKGNIYDNPELLKSMNCTETKIINLKHESKDN